MKKLEIKEMVQIECNGQSLLLEKDDNIAILSEDENMINTYADEIKELYEAGIEYGGYESPEPGKLGDKGKEILSHTYASCRKDGGDKEKCSKIAWSAVNKAGEK